MDKNKYNKISTKLFSLKGELEEETLRIQNALDFSDILNEDDFKRSIKSKIEKIKKELEEILNSLLI